MASDNTLPAVNRVGMLAPLGWLGGAWDDLWQAPATFLSYGFIVAFLSGAVALGLTLTGLAMWAVVLAAGFVFLAPMIAMGVYEGGRLVETGQKPTLARVAFVRSAFRADVVFLGLALFFMFGVWIELARVTYGLATYRLYRTLEEFIVFAATTPEGHGMLLWGTVIGGILAWLAFSLVVVSAPMLLDSRRDFFMATVTSIRCVALNTLPMLGWAAIIAAMIVLSICTGFLALIIVIPWLGLASWRAYRALVAESTPQNTP